MLLLVLVKRVRNYLKAFCRAFTYDLRRNTYLWFGFLWGIPIPVFSILLDPDLAGVAERGSLSALADNPVHLFFLAHPLLFALVFGAMGTVRRELEIENERLVARLTEMATVDSLTGLPNRRAVLDALGKAVVHAERTGEAVSVVMFDLNGFKAVNDEQGHAAGDAVLRRAAGALRAAIRKGDQIGRYGGDEFLLVAYGQMPSGDLLLRRAAELVKDECGLTFGTGLAIYPQDGRDAHRLIAVADSRLLDEKRERYAREGTGRR